MVTWHSLLIVALTGSAIACFGIGAIKWFAAGMADAAGALVDEKRSGRLLMLSGLVIFAAALVVRFA